MDGLNCSPSLALRVNLFSIFCWGVYNDSVYESEFWSERLPRAAMIPNIMLAITIYRVLNLSLYLSSIISAFFNLTLIYSFDLRIFLIRSIVMGSVLAPKITSFRES